MRAVQILPTKLLGVVVDHGDWPVERISIGGGMGQLSIEPEEDGSTNVSKTRKNNPKKRQGEIVEAEQQQRWWVGSVGHDDTLRMTDLEGFFRETEQAEIGEAFAADVRDDTDTEEDEKLEEDSQEKQEIRITESDSLERDEGESGGDSDIPQLKKRKRKAEKNTLNAVKKHKSKKSIAVESSFFDDL